MHITYNLLLLIITFSGGSIALWVNWFTEKRMQYLLAFSGSFLLCITFLHLLPETFTELRTEAGFYLVAGFFIQMIIQRLTHGVEHGHVHIHPHGDHEHAVPLLPIIGGLSIHAFMEGLPLGFNYLKDATEPSLYLAVAVHKIPEAILAASLVAGVKGRKQALLMLVFFSAITPVAASLAQLLGIKYHAMMMAVTRFIPLVAGAFIHIATTIFFESGTRQHMLTWQKVAAMLTGMALALLTLTFE